MRDRSRTLLDTLIVKFAMQRCYVWIDSEAVVLRFSSLSGKVINLNRKTDEGVETCLRRLAASVLKVEAKLSKQSKTKEEPKAALSSPTGASVPPGQRNDAAWQDGGRLSITLPGCAMATEWVVAVNTPFVASLMIPELPLVGHPVVALAELRFADGGVWTWTKDGTVLGQGESYTPILSDVGCMLCVSVVPMRGELEGTATTATCPFAVMAIAPAVLTPLESRAAMLPPASEDGLRVVSYNVLWGVSSDSAAKKDAAMPDKLPQQKGGGSMPSVDASTTPISAVDELPCSIYAAAYRQHVLAHELILYRADLVCVQEMTEVPFKLLAARLAPHGLRGAYGHPTAGRSGVTLEFGTFWRESKLSLQGSAVWHLGSLLDEPHSSGLRRELETVAPALATFLRDQPHQAQATLLRTRAEGRPVLCVNVHLIQNTIAANCRTLQAMLAVRQAHSWAVALGVGASSLVLCGDMNCYHPSDGVLTYLAGRAVPSSSYEWVYGRQLGKRPMRCSRSCAAVWRRDDACPGLPLKDSGFFCWDHTCPLCGCEKHNKYPTCFKCAQDGHATAHHDLHDLAAPDLAAPDLAAPALASRTPPDGPYFSPTLTLPNGLRNAYEAATGASPLAWLPFRPSTGGALEPGQLWVECRDHIFCSDDFSVAYALPPPSAQDSMRGMPNLTWASDHLAMVADLVWGPLAPPLSKSDELPEAPKPPVKRQKSEPSPSTTSSVWVQPEKQRSWGASSLLRALPGDRVRDG